MTLVYVREQNQGGHKTEQVIFQVAIKQAGRESSLSSIITQACVISNAGPLTTSVIINSDMCFVDLCLPLIKCLLGFPHS